MTPEELSDITHLDQKELKRLFSYNPETGLFTRITTTRNWKKGDIAGTENDQGYMQIRINRRKYYTHRLVWLYVYGVWPEEQMDHINHVRDDNRVANLREVTRQENGRNQTIRRTNKSGVTGVYWNVRDKIWMATMGVNRETVYLGSFHDKFEAICARLSANNKYGFHTNHGGSHGL